MDGENPQLLDQLSDDREIAALETALVSGEADALDTIYEMRKRQAEEEEEFGNYVEELLSQPCVRPEVREHGLQWFRSKIKIEEYQKCEVEATQVIAQYAFKLFQEDPCRTDFLLAGPTARVRVRIFVVPQMSGQAAA